ATSVLYTLSLHDALPISLSTNQLVGKDWLSESDQRRIERAYDFLLRLRTDLHYATGRATDILHMNLQEQIATRLGYSPRKGQLRSEEHTSELQSLAYLVC